VSRLDALRLPRAVLEDGGSRSSTERQVLSEADPDESIYRISERRPEFALSDTAPT
jgi:hypothetical protein